MSNVVNSGNLFKTSKLERVNTAPVQKYLVLVFVFGEWFLKKISLFYSTFLWKAVCFIPLCHCVSQKHPDLTIESRMWQIIKILIISCIEFNNTTWSGAWSFSFQVRCDRRSEKRFWQMKNERCSGAANLWDADGEDSVAQLFPHKQPKNLGRGELLALVNILSRYFLERVSHSQAFHQILVLVFPHSENASLTRVRARNDNIKVFCHLEGSFEPKRGRDYQNLFQPGRIAPWEDIAFLAWSENIF